MAVCHEQLSSAPTRGPGAGPYRGLHQAVLLLRGAVLLLRGAVLLLSGMSDLVVV